MKAHANQVAAFEKLLGLCNTHGATYNPSKASMNSTALNTLLAEAQKSIQAVHNAQVDLVIAINHRHRAFDPLPILATRILGALKAGNAPPDLVADINRIRLRFRYPKSHASCDPAMTKTSGEAAPTTQGVEIPSANTPRGPISQLDFNSKIENFVAIVGLLGIEPTYEPNEADLTLDALNTHLAGLRQLQKAVLNAQLVLHDARQNLKDVLYGNAGVYGTSVRVKMYIRSIFGYNSAPYKVVRKIRFKNNG